LTVLRIEMFGPYTLAGHLCQHSLSPDLREMYFKISNQWREFAEVAHNLPALPPRLGYGVGFSSDDLQKSMTYFCSVVVPGKDVVPSEFFCLELPQLHCAVFEHHSHVTSIACTLQSIFTIVLPDAGIRPAAAKANLPSFIQRYSEQFDPETGLGGLEILIPIDAREMTAS